MGFFSKTCAKTHLPVVAEPVGITKLNRVVALLPDGRKFTGSYDGYGRVDGHDEVAEAWDKVKFVLEAYYEGETYDDLGNSGPELAQGFFMSKDFLHYCLLKGPFKNRAEYTRTFKRLANWL
jgi:hypothetical protein